MERRPQESESSRDNLPIEILQDILVRLPTKDVVRSSCVSKLWCSIVGDPSFRKLHAAASDVAAPSESEALLVSKNSEPGRHDEARVFNLSSGNNKDMRHVGIPAGYSLTGICNGFLCFAVDYDQAPVLVFNPVTGETLELPKAPRFSASQVDSGVTQLSRRFVLGFSPSTKEYKMFRLSFPQRIICDNTNYIALYTLGGSGVWRQYSYTSEFRAMHGTPPPVHIDCDLFVPVECRYPEPAARMLVLDVATGSL